jgi:predicted transcriptional regulator
MRQGGDGLMPNVRGDKRRTIVCPDDLWDGLGEYAAERSTTRGAVIRDQIRDLLEDTEISDDTADAADA